MVNMFILLLEYLKFKVEAELSFWLYLQKTKDAIELCES